MQRIDYINAKLNGEKVPSPQSLYKYRPFDEFAYDMLDNNYLYLCQANQLDDPSECKTSLSIRDLYDVRTNQIKFKCIHRLLQLVEPYTSADNFQQIRTYVAQTVMPNGLVRRHFLLDSSADIQDLVPEVDIFPLINFLGNIPERLNDPRVQSHLEKLFILANDAREGMGICSLTELDNSTEMWEKYANKSTGYCVEYDMTEYKKLYALYPVVYQDDRETDIASNVLAAFIGEMIFGISSGQIQADRSQYVRMFLTKDTKWAYQEEWRLLGDARERIEAPPIRAITVGKNAVAKDKEKIAAYCDAHGIRLSYL